MREHTFLHLRNTPYQLTSKMLTIPNKQEAFEESDHEDHRIRSDRPVGSHRHRRARKRQSRMASMGKRWFYPFTPVFVNSAQSERDAPSSRVSVAWNIK